MPTIHKRTDYTLEGPELGTPMSMADLKALADRCGSHYFEPATMRFFRSRIGSTVKAKADGWYFVTSEQFVGSQGAAPRRYTLRRAAYRQDEAGALYFTIDTVGAFNQAATSRQAWQTLGGNR